VLVEIAERGLERLATDLHQGAEPAHGVGHVARAVVVGTGALAVERGGVGGHQLDDRVAQRATAGLS